MICNSAIEFSQLWHPPFLQWIGATLFGSLFIGSGLACRGFCLVYLGMYYGLVLVVCLKHKIMKKHQKI
ncbi:hypothetical protein QUB60_15585 [Microcoleus sp. A2-C5]|uniref:hypothetical protein n=1 Tax=unclassified Microcoleus TaxID=2642155 RepID=UPI002FCF9FA1